MTPVVNISVLHTRL